MNSNATTFEKAFIALIAALVGLTLVPPALAQTAAQPADLVVDQPAYVDGEVQRQSANGTRVYVVSGEEIEMRPTNFESGNVIDFGVREQAASLTYDEEMNEYVLKSNSSASYHVYWIVQRQITVEQNNTTTTRNVSTRYEAIIRVEGKTGLVHLAQSSLQDMRQRAANWTDLLDRLRKLGLLEPDDNVDQVITQMVAAFRVFENPFSLLSGGLTQVLMMLGLTRGGNLLVAIVALAFGGVVYTMASELYGYQIIEDVEGEAKEQITRLEAERRRQALQNVDVSEAVPDHVAAYWRDKWNVESLWEASAVIQSTLLPRRVLRDRLAEMETDGWRAVIHHEDGERQHAELEVEDDIDRDEADEVVRPSALTDDELHLLDWDAEPIRTYDVLEPEAEYDDEFEVMDFDSLIDAFDVDTRRIDDEEFVEYLLEMVQYIREHRYTDEQGRIRQTRDALNALLQIQQQVADKHEMPVAEYTADAIERALIEHDPAADAEKTVDRIQHGISNDD